MAHATASVSKNLALADLDELLRKLLSAELEAVQMTGVEITFDAPTRERAAAWRLPAVNLFLYDLREAASPRDRGWHPHDNNGGPATLERSPLRLACTFAITAWTQDVIDEHQLLSQVLSVLLAYPVLPGEMLPPSLRIGSPPIGLGTRVAHPKEEGRADFWSAIGSPYKVSLEYMVTILCVAGQSLARGARVSAAAVSSDRLHASRVGGSSTPGAVPRPTSGSCCRRPARGRPPARRGTSSSTRCRPASTPCWPAAPTARRPARP